ncbi:MAG: hypothetical protein ACYTEV_05175 [Planctomycetota bacterium]
MTETTPVDAPETADTPADAPADAPATGPLPQVRAVMRGVSPGRIELALPHSDYLMHLGLEVDPARIAVEPGKRIRGEVTATAMRFHQASGGGRFIEPVIGEPRIVAGTVLHVDRAGGRVLIDCAMPIWIRPEEADQDWSVFQERALVTGYLRSGMVFTPAEADLTPA